MPRPDVVLCAPVRTAIGTFNGALKATPAPQPGAAVVRAVLARSGLAGADIGTVVMGNVIQAGTKMNPARQAAIGGGVPVEVPAMTVNRVCGSGAQAIVSAAQEVMLGSIDSVIAGGVERSQARFAAAQAAGKFDAEIEPIELPGRKGPTRFAQDEHNRPSTTLESLAVLKPVFRKDGTITAGNSPGLNSGAAAMVVAEADWAARHGLRPMARLVSYGIGAVEPGFFGLGPVPAVRQALERAGWRVGDVDRFEINEAFAAIVLAVIRDLGLAEDVVNVEGGAIAHGHPIGATGAVLTTRLLHAMERDGVRRGVVTLCIGGGQGIALALERLA